MNITIALGMLWFVGLVAIFAALIYLCDAFVMPLDSDDWEE